MTILQICAVVGIVFWLIVAYDDHRIQNGKPSIKEWWRE